MRILQLQPPPNRIFIFKLIVKLFYIKEHDYTHKKSFLFHAFPLCLFGLATRQAWVEGSAASESWPRNQCAPGMVVC